MKVSIGICAYNEAENIGRLLECLKSYPFQVIVVASGCTDDTVRIAMSFDKVIINIEKERMGKAHAVNTYLNTAKNIGSDICVLQSADTLPTNFTYKYLLDPLLSNSEIGMVGCHPIPINTKDTMINQVGCLLWKVHHNMAMKHAKAGEVCAFRNVVESIDNKTAVDEVSIEHQIVKQGYKVAYANDAIVFNKAPTSIEDFIKQRQRIYLGHMKLKDQGYRVATMNQFEVLKSTLKATKDPVLLAYAAYLESQARNRARANYKDQIDNSIWSRVDTTKELN